MDDLSPPFTTIHGCQGKWVPWTVIASLVYTFSCSLLQESEAKYLSSSTWDNRGISHTFQQLFCNRGINTPQNNCLLSIGYLYFALLTLVLATSSLWHTTAVDSWLLCYFVSRYVGLWYVSLTAGSIYIVSYLL